MTLSPSYALGLCFLVIISILWTIASMVVQHLYQDMEFHSPFLVVYIGTSLFSIFLPTRLVYERWRGWVHNDYCSAGHFFRPSHLLTDDDDDNANTFNNSERINNHNNVHEVIIIPWRTTHTRRNVGEVKDGGRRHSGRITLTSLPVTLRDNQHYFETSTEEQPTSFDRTHSQSSPIDAADNIPSNSRLILSHQDHISMASKVAPLWFISNYFYATSLEWTSIASSTVLASMGSIFAFAFATCSRYGDERITKWKLLGVILCFSGGVVTALIDNNADNEAKQDFPGYNDSVSTRQRSFLGDCAGVISAIGYGAYTVLLRYLCPKDEDRMSMQLFFGYIGALNMCLLLPVAIWVILSSKTYDVIDPNETSNQHENSHIREDAHTTLTRSVFLFLILKGLLDNVLSDYLWARAVILTSATVASVGVGLTIPMAFIADWIMGSHNNVTSFGDVIGALLVLIGFVFVNLDCEDSDQRERQFNVGEEDADEQEDYGNTMEVVGEAEINDTERLHFRIG